MARGLGKIAMANKTLDRIRADRRVEIVDDERHVGNGIIITLRQGWSFSIEIDNRVAGADTATQARTLLTTARKFEGPCTP